MASIPFYEHCFSSITCLGMPLSNSVTKTIWMTCKGWASTLAVAGEQLVFPAACCICSRPLPEQGRGVGKDGLAHRLCDGCRIELCDQTPRCKRCGLPGVGGDGCGGCRQLATRLGKEQPAWQEISVLGRYDGLLREAVLQSKHPAGEDLAELLALLLISQRPVVRSWEIATVVPVPMHWLRRWRRGTNAAAGMAGQLARELGVPVRHALARSSLRPPQRSLPAAARPANVAASFRVRDRRVSGKTVLLVDDVTTTGATLAAATRLLLEAGASLVYAAVAARAEASADSF